MMMYNFFSINFSGVDVTANQEEISDHETFQLEFDDKSKRWYMRTMQDKFFTLGGAGGIQAKEVRRLDKFLFSLFFFFKKKRGLNGGENYLWGTWEQGNKY